MKTMNESANKKRRRRKTLSAALAIAMVLTMLLSGTLAYFYQSKAINLLTGDGYKKVIGHDDYDDVSYKKGGKTNKDVYVENAGETAVWVRVKLEEGLERNGEVIQSLTAPTAHTMDQDSETFDTTPALGTGSEKINKEKHAEVFHQASNGFLWTMGGAATDVLLAKDDQIAKMQAK